MSDFEALNEKALEAAAKALNDLWCPTCQPYSATGGAHIQYCEKSARAAITAYLAAISDGWQPIETAPKDRTPILVHCENRQTYAVFWDWTGNMADYSESAWHLVGGGPLSVRRGRRVPTHWMPLPSPPALKETTARATLTEQNT